MDETMLIRSFGILNRTFLKFLSGSYSDMGISYSEGAFLVNIGRKAGVSQEELAEELAIDKAAVARAVQGLRAKGYVRAERLKSDRRENRLSLTGAGKELFGRIEELNHRWIEYALSDISHEEAAVSVEAIGKMAARAKTFTR